ncbi:hypothetical protein Tco_0356792 [Tanacetum coccineum]
MARTCTACDVTWPFCQLAGVAAMSDSAFRRVEDDEEDEEIEESSDSDSESEDAEDEGPTVEDEGPTAEDEGPAVGDKGLAAGDEGPVMRVESLGLGGDEAVPEGQQRAPRLWRQPWGSGSVPESERPERVSALRQPPLTTWIDLEDGRAYINVPSYPPPTPHIQVEGCGGLIHDHTVRLGELSHALFERYDRDIEELFTRSGAVRDEIFFQIYRLRSLEHEQERVAVTPGAI